ncbi:thiamine pyrophosphate-binding protein [Paenibacillus dendritiformis]|uniref:thiamine pyrophosphate-binding protein n=1 Tax=Paenibacillus dendritiformis TaxID=130049 RepID=UPI00248CD05D|nr:thiamine pyrophosphate-binding protein [Paenibacillus dendritiformis]WGU93819.1 thiamine pyrophosphate-binding protein [Paenibacillus dendritiformis]
MNMRVADYITNALYEAGGKHVFLVTGGMIMHLTDALYQHEKQTYVCCHHEQAVAMAAEAYGRYSGDLGVAYVTAGPGALNTITGVAGSFIDSSPSIIVAGNSKVSLAKIKGPRQFPLQGFDSLPIFDRITKYAVMLDDISRVKYEVQKCIHIAKSHRVGPVYLEVPVDIQGAIFDPDLYEDYVPESPKRKNGITYEQIEMVKKAILSSKRPCLLVGAGVRLSGAIEQFMDFVNETGIPVLTSRLGMDLIDYEHPQFVGRPGTYGDRPANFTIQNADLLIVVGCRLAIGLVGYDFKDFGKKSKKIIVDIDELELNKPSVIPDIAVKEDAKVFFEKMNDSLRDFKLNYSDWVSQTQKWKQKYPVDLPEYSEEKQGVNSYRAMTIFSERVDKDATFVVDTGSCFHVHAQAFKVKQGQRHIITGGLSTMGYTPAAIGVSVAKDGSEVYCITGDGSFQMNLQELQTITHYKLPVKFFLFNNGGYLLIRHTQNNFMEGRYIGESNDSGVGFASLEKVAETFGLGYMKISNLKELDSKIDEFIHYNGAMICEVVTPANQLLIPRVASEKLADGTMVSKAYDDMFPFLSREEYKLNCLD